MWTALAALASLLHQPKAAEKPRLVVLIAVDQLIPEQLQRLEGRFTGGFKRFLDEGAVFWRATVDYAGTETGPGHATLATGRWPLHHGIVGNLFFDRASGANVYCVGDAESHPLTSRGVDETKGGVSPAKLLGTGLGDFLKARAAGAKTVTLAGKDRSAILFGGRQPELALWWDGVAGGFASSSYYGEKLADFVTVWNGRWAERARGWEWRSELEGDWSALGTASDERAGESSRGGKTLPRTLPKEDGPLAAAVLFSPLLDFFTLELATFALEMQALGQDDAVDLLGLSLSGCDILGHSYGPDSVEVTDLLVRNDRDLGRFFEALDTKVGKGRWVACLSSDHGVLDLPEMLRASHVGARRIKGPEVAAMKKTVEEALAEVAGEAVDLKLRYAELGFGFDEAAAKAAGLAPAELRARIAEAAEAANWVEDAYTLEELLGANSEDPWLRLYQRSATPERCADVVLRPEPWLLFDFAEGTSHGSPYPYDRRVPLAFLGPGVKAQRRFDAASPTDAVPTLLALLGLPLPGDLDGRVLEVR